MKIKKGIALLLTAVMTLQIGVQSFQVSAQTAVVQEATVSTAIIKDGNTVLRNQYVFLKNVNGAYVVAKPDESGAVLYFTDGEGRPSLYKKDKQEFISVYVNGHSSKYLVQSGKLYTGLYKKGNKQICYVKGLKYVAKKLKKTTSINNKKIKYFTYKIKKKVYAFNQKGVMYKNQIIDNYYYDSTGVRNKDAQIKQAVKFVKAHGGKKNSRSAKLRNCFNYLANRNHYRHDSDHTARLGTKSGLPVAANKMLKNTNSGTGNCFGWASAYAYIATVLGYEAQVCRGTIGMVSGGMGPHGWTMVNYGGSWKICDANMNYKRGCYMKSYSNYPFRLGSGKTYFTLTTANGKAIWKD